MFSIQDRFETVNFRPSGFDYMRIMLAISVILLHSFEVSYGNQIMIDIWTNRIIRPFVALIIPMFFALSGFLVAGSLERNKSLISFLGLRAIRLMPGLAVEITLSAMILGPILTNKNLTQYFTNPEFFHYFTNIIGIINYKLPGLFSQNPYSYIVNSQLWTEPFEIEGYAVMALIASIGLFQSKRLLFAAAVAIQLSVAIFVLIHPQPFELFGLARLLIGPFLAGFCLYRCREIIPYNRIIAILCAIILYFLLRHSKSDDYMVPFPVAYLTVYLGLLNPPRNRIVLSGDYSYGMYIYGYPIQQAFASLGPWTHHWWLDMIVCLPITAAFAIFSWFFVEKPAQKLKGSLYALERNAFKFEPFYRYTRLVFLAHRDAKPIQAPPTRT
jgi:peptidoglycan/LPS O-acetylase OafA/YrhL